MAVRKLVNSELSEYFRLCEGPFFGLFKINYFKKRC